MRRTAFLAALSCALFATLGAGSEDVILWQTLQKYLPATLEGLAPSGKPSGSTISANEFSMSQVIQSYGENGSGSVSISNSPQVLSQFQAQAAMAKMNIDTTEMYMRATEIKGFPGVEIYQKEDRTAIVYVLLSNAVMVLVQMEDVDDTAACVGAAAAMDLEGLNSLSAEK